MAAAVLLVFAAVVRWRASPPDHAATLVAPSLSATKYGVVSDSALQEAEDLAVGNDPFRLSNSPPESRYDPASDGTGLAVRAMTQLAARPIFALKAIVGGPPWQAVIDGIPGQPAGTLTRAGTKYDKLVVRSVTRDSVIIQGPDTSWVLSFERRP